MANEDMTPFGETATQQAGMQANNQEDTSVVFTITNHGGSAIPGDGIADSLFMHVTNPNLSGGPLNQGCPINTEYSGSDNGIPIYNGGYPTKLPILQAGQSLQIEDSFDCTIGVRDFTIGGVGPGMLPVQ